VAHFRIEVSSPLKMSHPAVVGNRREA
jgi:hypothetical protein